MHEEQSVSLFGRKFVQSEALPFDVAEVGGLRYPHEGPGGVVAPGMERAGEATLGAMALGFEDGAPVST